MLKCAGLAQKNQNFIGRDAILLGDTGLYHACFRVPHGWSVPKECFTVLMPNPQEMSCKT
jgi:hypothetical protein